MRILITQLFTVYCSLTFGQDKYNYVHFNKLTEVTGTEYVIASIENVGKMFETKERYFLFINTNTGQTKKVDFPKDAYIENFQQIRIDSLGINEIIVFARTIDLDGKKGIDWEDPKQVIILSKDGQEKNQLTDNNFFVSTWTVNRKSGTIVITGYFDTNNNNKYDKTDKSEVQIFNLKTLRLIFKI